MKARTDTRRDMDDLAVAIQAHVAAHPDDFDGREELWMQRENLREQIAVLDTYAKPTWNDRMLNFLFGPKRGNVGLVGACMVIINLHPLT